MVRCQVPLLGNAPNPHSVFHPMKTTLSFRAEGRLFAFRAPHARPARRDESAFSFALGRPTVTANSLESRSLILPFFTSTPSYRHVIIARDYSRHLRRREQGGRARKTSLSPSPKLQNQSPHPINRIVRKSFKTNDRSLNQSPQFPSIPRAPCSGILNFSTSPNRDLISRSKRLPEREYNRPS